MTNPLIALDDGHGMETAGKRTPAFPDGRVMRENEFNRDVVARLDEMLKRCGFRTLLVAPTDVDTPLTARTDSANKARADLYVSVHANAIGSGGWNGTRGIETFHYTQASETSKRAAAIIHRYLIGGTKLPDRGVKAADFHVLRETNMPAVLVETAFMTNQEDALLLMSEAYRAECAEELARAICEIYNVTFVKEVVAAPPKPSNPLSVTVIVEGTELDDGRIIDGVTYAPVRQVAEALGEMLGVDVIVKWDGKSKTVTITK